MEPFTVVHRNFEHWDVYLNTRRAFCVRGESGAFYIRDEREGVPAGEQTQFKTLPACMSYICDELMFEQSPKEER